MPSIAIVTGANNGIGFETAVGLAEKGLHVIMACRNSAKAQDAIVKIKRRVPSAALEFIALDLSDQDSVRAFATTFRRNHQTLDILINNAGVLTYTGKTTSSGTELQFATNHLGHFLLTCLLIDMMPDDPASRIVSLSSVAHKGARINFGDLTCGGNGGAAYGQSKLACLMFAEELDRKLKAAGSRITSLAAHPGGSDSGLFDEMSRVQYYILKAVSPFITHSNKSAAKPSLHAALAPDVKGGDYYGPTGIMELRGPVVIARRDPTSLDKSQAAQLWETSEHLTQTQFKIV